MFLFDYFFKVIAKGLSCLGVVPFEYLPLKMVSYFNHLIIIEGEENFDYIDISEDVYYLLKQGVTSSESFSKFFIDGEKPLDY